MYLPVSALGLVKPIRPFGPLLAARLHSAEVLAERLLRCGLTLWRELAELIAKLRVSQSMRAEGRLRVQLPNSNRMIEIGEYPFTTQEKSATRQGLLAEQSLPLEFMYLIVALAEIFLPTVQVTPSTLMVVAPRQGRGEVGQTVLFACA
jgi:hypothetical protein